MNARGLERKCDIGGYVEPAEKLVKDEASAGARPTRPATA